LPELLRRARIRSALTQKELAVRMSTSQSAIASLEAGRSNPTVETVARWAAALGFSLEVVVNPLPAADPVVERYKIDVDRTLLRENLRRSVEERIRTLAEWQENVAELEQAARKAKRQLRVAEKSR
jgi:transcriptional regulator with XRE-family HTH domain